MAYTVAEAEVLILPNADKFGEMAKAQINEQADSIGREAGDRIGKGIQERVRASLDELPDAKIGVELDQGKLDAELADLRAKTDEAGNVSGRSMGRNITQGAADEAGHSSPLIVAAIAAGLLAGAPLVTAVGGTLMTALAGVLVMQAPEVQNAATGVGTAFSDSFQEAAVVAIPFFVDALNKVSDAATGLAAQAAPAFAELQGPLDALVNGVVGMVTNLMPGLVRSIQLGLPVFQGLGDLLAKTGTGLSDLFTIAAGHAQAAGQVFSSLGDILGALLPILGQLVGAGAELGSVILPPLAAVLTAVADAMNFLSPILPELLAGFVALKVTALLAPMLGTLAASLEATGASAMVSVAGLTGLEAAGEAAGAGFSVAAAGARGLQAAIGPIGWIIAGISLVLPLFIGRHDEAAEASKKMAEAEQNLTQALQQSKGAIDDNVRASAAQQAQKQGLFTYADQIHISYSEMTDAILGNAQALADVKAAHETFVSGFTGPWAGTMVNAFDNVFKKVLDLSGAVKGEVANQQQLAQAMNAGLNPAQENANRLQGIANTASAASGQINTLKTALDQLTGKAVSEDEAQVAVTKSLEAAATATKGLTGKVLDHNGALDLNTAKGAAVSSALTNLSSTMHQQIATLEQHGQTVDQVSAKNDELRKKFYDQALALTHNAGAAQDLTNRYYGIPGEVYTEIKADTAQATQAAANFKAYWDSIVSRHVTLTVSTNGPQVVFGNRTTGTIMEAAGGVVHPYAGGGFEPMQGGIAQVVAPQTYRLIGDRVTDDEAYIPINASARSLAILAQTAGRMGYGLSPRGEHQGGRTDARHYTFHVSAPAGDPAAIARSIRDAQRDLEFLHG